MTSSDSWFGPRITASGTRFRLWAPGARRMELVLQPGTPAERTMRLERTAEPDLFELTVPRLGHGVRYLYRKDGGAPLPDPASRFQPEGVHGPSQLVALDEVAWSDQAWPGVPPEHQVVYELRVGRFSPEGDFDGLRRRLDHLQQLGVTTLELMPLAAFAGQHNWGYDGVFHFAPHAGYGTPGQLARLVDACHARGLAVILDLVTNHFGSEGNAMWRLARRFFDTSRKTPWSPAIAWNLEPVLRYFDEVADYWVRTLHLDGLRMDAFCAIPQRARPVHLKRLVQTLDRCSRDQGQRQLLLLLESTANEVQLLQMGTPRVTVTQLDFDLQRSAHALLTGERHHEYQDFTEPEAELGRCLERGFAFCGRHSVALGGVRGDGGKLSSWDQVVFYLQNHDTCGNRYLGQRLEELARSPRALRALTALVLLHPAPPMLFMGQEWGSHGRFHFFVDVPAPLGRAIQRGRLKLFHEMVGRPPWPQQAPACFEPAALEDSRLRWDELGLEAKRQQLHVVRLLLALRRQWVPQMSRQLAHTRLERSGRQLTLRIAAASGTGDFLLCSNLDPQAAMPLESGAKLLHSSDPLDSPAQLAPETTALLRQRA